MAQLRREKPDRCRHDGRTHCPPIDQTGWIEAPDENPYSEIIYDKSITLAFYIFALVHGGGFNRLGTLAAEPQSRPAPAIFPALLNGDDVHYRPPTSRTILC